uniref:Ig-like domain-containing protein n=1 Tax=Photinus pyralis TaxID=7054 RepID=A0A1Y1LY72_PHOPY
MPFTFGEELMNAGDTVSAQCTITKGDLPVQIEWYLNGNTISEQDGILTSYIGKRLSILSIESVQYNHIGEYTCGVRNPAGSTNYTTYLNVNGIIFSCMVFVVQSRNPS